MPISPEDTLKPFSLVGSFQKERGLKTVVKRGWVAGDEYIEIYDEENGRPRLGYMLNVQFLPQLQEILAQIAPESNRAPGIGQESLGI